MTSESSKNLFINEHCIKKFDISLEDFVFFKKFLEQNVTIEMIEHEKTDQIKNILSTLLPIQYRKLWIIVVGRDLGYNLQYKKKCLLIIKVKELSFFFFQGKYIDMPVLEVLEEFPSDLSEDKVNKYLSRITKLEDNSENNKYFDHFQKWTAKFFAKHEDKFSDNYDNFENLYLKKIKTELQIFAAQGYWNIFVGQKVNYFVEAHRNEVAFLYSIDLGGLPGNKGKKVFAVFQKKGVSDPYFASLKGRYKEALGFIGMLLLFIGYVGCRNYEPALPEEILGSDGLFYIVAPKKNLKDRVCDHKEQLMFLGGILFFGYIGLKLVTSFYRGMKAKNSIKKKKQA